MIRGIGVDLTEVARLGAALDRQPALAARLFTPAERDLPLRSLAARFAAKEAVAKALGSPGGLSWQDCEVLTDEAGAPAIRVTGTVAELASQRGVNRFHLSLTHDGGFAIAMVVAEGD